MSTYADAIYMEKVRLIWVSKLILEINFPLLILHE